jgi:hypothetical protein
MGRFVFRAAFLGLVAMAFLLPACGSGTGKQLLPAYTGPTVTGQDKLPNTFGPGSETPAPTATPAPPSSEPPQYAELVVFNNGTLPVFFLYVVPSTSPTWGVDQLGTEVIMPGETFTLTQIPPDTYDSLAEFSDGTQVVSWDNVAEAGNIYTWTVSNV